MTLPLAITMGDSSGVGPEIILQAYKRRELPESILIVGDASALALANRLLGCGVHVEIVSETAAARPGKLNLLDLGLLREADLRPGQISAVSGHAALRYVERATRLALAGEVCGMATLPIHKEATRLSQKNFTGHTEYLAELCGVNESAMMLVSEKLIVSHVSTHISLAEAIGRVQSRRILTVIELTVGALRKLRPKQRIAVAGLNPHAGEHGAFGLEEQREITPAIELARTKGWDVSGPFAPDTVFRSALSGAFEAVICMYHDQGHIPLKLLDFEGGINVTLGLPIVRTSVDHGTAFDIAYQGKAFTRSLAEACRLALQLGPAQK